jgi:AAA15 family ATPase/GTPase
MLIDFTVENYRSIKGPITLSAIAQKGRASENIAAGARRRRIKPDEEIAPAFPVSGRGFELLPVLGLFGANASGKSNLINALDGLLGFMAHGLVDEFGLANNSVPFRLAEETVSSPTNFTLRVTVEGFVFSYALSISGTKILVEKLEYLPSKKRTRILFERRWDTPTNKFVWKNGEDFVGSHTQLEATLQDQEPFMSFLTRRLAVPVVHPLQKWLFPRGLKTTLEDRYFDSQMATLLCRSDSQLLADVSTIVQRFDTGISGLLIEGREVPGHTGSVRPQLMVLHPTKIGHILWPLQEESMGTQRLFTLATRLVLAFRSGLLVLVDELGSNIHPNITREIVRLFQDPKTNPKGAQLIFTSHDNTLQQRNLLRRDQIWFTQKRTDGSTELYPLTDFHPRNDLAIDKAYLDGRFGAVPQLPQDEEILPPLEIAR